jgi:hypothetical protein
VTYCLFLLLPDYFNPESYSLMDSMIPMMGYVFLFRLILKWR